MSSNFAAILLQWFDQYGRKNLPWQREISPYSVWISEIMLQQTQVAAVVPYFERFLLNFPTLHSLAEASLDAVLHRWTGLGYYARARNAHKTANIIATDFNGIFPADLSTLLSLPGIGRSTAGAILSIAFQQAAPILDGNVKRVLARYHAVSGYPGNKAVENRLWSLSTQYTPTTRCADYTQAIMDLGATICTRTKPSCTSCPLSTRCRAHKANKTADFPAPRKKGVLPVKTTQFLIIRNQTGAILLEKRPPSGIWGGLWSFPECKENTHRFCADKWGLHIQRWTAGEVFRHTFSHFHLDITPVFIDAKTKELRVMDADCIWYCPTGLPKVGLAAPVKNLLQQILSST